MKLRKSFDFRKVLAIICFLVAVLCFAEGLKPADAFSYEVVANLSVPSIGLQTAVTKSQFKDHKLQTPETTVGSFSRYPSKTLLIGHASTVFSKLDNLKIGDEFSYNNTTYIIKNIEIKEKSKINMDLLLGPENNNTIVLMTCIGNLYENGDASHRLIITATSE